MSRLGASFTYIGAGFLVLTALAHGYAFLEAAQVANSEEAHPFTAYFLEPIWLAPSITWMALALMASLRPSVRLAVIIAFIPLIQAMIMFVFMGPFPGAIAVGFCGVLLLLGAIIQRRDIHA